MSKIRRIFPGGNTANGFFSLHYNIISEKRNKLYILKGMPGGGKSSLMKEIGGRMFDKGYSIEYHHCPSDPNSIDGVVIEELKVAIIDGTPPHPIDPIYPGLTDKIVDLAEFIDENKLKEKEDIIRKAKTDNKYAYSKAFSYFKAAKIILEEIAQENSKNTNIKGINNETRKLIDIVFSKLSIPVKSNGFKERFLFSSAFTPEGFANYTDTILKWVEDVYYLDGSLGIGKSYILDRLYEEGKLRGYQMEIYFDPLIPGKKESLFIKELDTIITSNVQGEKFAKGKIDLNKYFDKSRINHDDMETLDYLMDKGIKSLNGAKNNHFILEKTYKPNINYLEIDKARERIYEEILKL